MEQPWVDDWPMWDEPLSKIPIAFDVAEARKKLARKFNTERAYDTESRAASERQGHVG